jgi:hypothetical protein
VTDEAIMQAAALRLPDLKQLVRWLFEYIPEEKAMELRVALSQAVRFMLWNREVTSCHLVEVWLAMDCRVCVQKPTYILTTHA